MNNLRKFTTQADYSAATLNYPAVSWVVSEDIVHYDKTEPAPPTPTFSGLTVYYNITDTSQPTELFNAGGGGSGSGSGSGSGGALPSAMIIDGTAVEVTNTYQFSTTGEHIVNYSFVDNQIPEQFLGDGSTGRFSTVAKVEIGDAITSIGEYAFTYCSGLTTCTIGSGVTSIGLNAFNNCTGLTSIDIPNSVTSIGSGAFYGCNSLTSITVDSNNTIYDSRNDCNAIIETNTNELLIGCQNTVIPNTVTSIGNSAFYNCNALTSIYIPDSVTSIGVGAFYNCRRLTSIDIPSGVTSIGNSTFTNCSSLTSITIGSGVTSIGINAFASCNSLTGVTIPSGVKSIGDYAFESCSSLTSIVCNATTAPTIQNKTFNNIKISGTLTVPSGSTGYNVWMQNANFYLGKYNWTKVEQ